MGALRMSCRIVLPLLVLTQEAFAAPENVWEPIGPYVATVFSSATHPTDPDNVLVGTFFNGVYRSLDGGLSWTHLDSGFGSAFVPTMAADPLNPGTFYAGTFERGVFKSTDGGDNWISASEGLSSGNVEGMAISPLDPQQLIACSFVGPYRTEDGGAQWASWDKGSLYDLTLLQNVPRTALPGSNNSGRRLLVIAGEEASNQIHIRFFDSPSAPGSFNEYLLPAAEAAPLVALLEATSWDATLLDPTGRLALADEAILQTGHVVTLPSLSAVYSRTFPDVAYLGTNGNGVYITDDNGNTGSPWNEGIEDLIIFDLELHPDIEAVYAATNKGVFSRGAADPAWTDLKYNLLDANVTQVHFLNDGRLISSSGVGAFVLETVDDEIWDLWYPKPARLVITHPLTPRVLVAGSVDTLEMTQDDGQTFQSVVTGIQNNFPDALAAFRAEGQTILTAGVERGVWRTPGPDEPLPLVWEHATSIREHLILELSPHPTRDGHIYAGTERAGVWFSEDAARTWRQRTDGIHPSRIYDIVQAPVGDQTFYSATEVGLYRSDDHAQHWRLATPDALPTLVTAVETDVIKPGFVYYGTASGILSFTTNNKDFTIFAQVGQSVRAIRSVPYEGIYVILADGSVQSSRNDTLALEPRGDGLDHPVLDIRIDPTQSAIAYAATSGGGVYKTLSEGSVWEPVNTGLDDPYVFSLAIDPQSGNRLFATTTGAVYRSENGGASWTRISASGLPSGVIITDIVIDPLDSLQLYCSALDTGVFHSTDGGITWADTQLPQADSSGSLPIAFSTDVAGELLVGSEFTGIQMRDGVSGQWQHSGNGLTDLVRGIAISHQNPDRIFAASLNSGVFRSLDAGDTWTLSGLQDHVCLHLEVNPQDDNIVYVGTTRGLSATFDGGGNWYELGQRVLYADTLSRLAGDPQTLLVGGTGGYLFRSRDDGATWQSSSKGLPERTITVLEDAGASGLFAGMDRAGLYRSTDAGWSWQKISTEALEKQVVASIAVEATFGQIFIATKTGGLYSSDLEGGSMAPLTLPRENYVVDNLTAVSLDPFHIDKLMVSRTNQSGQDTSLHISTNRGVDWSTPDAASGLPPGTIFSLAASPHQPNLWLCGHQSGIYRSIDGGLTWAPTQTGSLAVASIAFAADNSNLVYAAGAFGGFLTSWDGGLSWTPSTIDPGIVISDISPPSPGSRLAVSTFDRGTLFSKDHGLTWTPGIDGEITFPVVLFVAVNPANPDNLFVATSGKGVLRSRDGGRSFSEANNGLGNHLSLLSLMIDPTDPEVIYAGTVTGGVYVSEDGGDNWTPINDGKFHELTIALAIDPVDSRRIYAGFEGGGVYRMQRSPKYLRAEGDPDGDGLSSIWEQYLNLDPLSGDDGDPNLASLSVQAGPTNEIRWFKGLQAPAEPVTATLQWSRDLAVWQMLGSMPGPLPYGMVAPVGTTGNLQEMGASVVDPDPSQPLFFRLRLER